MLSCSIDTSLSVETHSRQRRIISRIAACLQEKTDSDPSLLLRSGTPHRASSSRRAPTDQYPPLLARTIHRGIGWYHRLRNPYSLNLPCKVRNGIPFSPKI